MTIKRKRSLTEEISDFAAYWQVASVYAKAGNMAMAKRILDAAPVPSKRSPEQEARLLQQACEAIRHFQARDAERRLQGLPPLEPDTPQFH